MRAGRKVTVYGDFDCDGVCATTILVKAIRNLGGDCDWYIPDRLGEGYGLNPEAIRKIAGRGTALIITVDCGITAVAEVALARELGMEVIVTDHHRPGDELPDCPVLHPEISGYPFPLLCGAAVAAKLAEVLRRQAGVDPAGNEADLDLVALATVADMMPLEGENRQLVRSGVKVARRAGRVGLAALMGDAKIEPSQLTATDFGFRLGPRINAAGRVQRADAGVELFLTDSRERAAEIARELAAANAERRRIEREVERAAKQAMKDTDESAAAVVVAGEGWHPGVVGIVAGKLVKETGKPSVVISLDGETGRGSARSVPGVNLHAALSGVSDLLEGFGGHAAAAGMTIRAERIDEFRSALAEAVEATTAGEPVEAAITFDVVSGGEELGLGLAEELERLQPFGNGNPPVRILIPGALVEDVQEMGEGRHCRFTIVSGSHRARAVCFGRGSLDLEPGERTDLIAELEVNQWNGSIEPRLKVEETAPVRGAGSLAECEEPEWWARFESAFSQEFSRPASPAEAALSGIIEPVGLPGVGLANLIGSGERLLVLTADAGQRWEALGGAALARFLPDRDRSLTGDRPGEVPPEPGEPALLETALEEPDNRGSVAGIWAGSPRERLMAALEARVLVTDFDSLSGPLDLGSAIGPAGFDRVALLDPPFTATGVAWLIAWGLPVHLLAGPDEFTFATRLAGHRLDLSTQLRGLYRGFRDRNAIDGQMLAGPELRELLARDGKRRRAPEESATLLRVLIETGTARSSGEGSARQAGAVSSKKTNLTDSAVFVHHLELHKEQNRFLSQFNRSTKNP